MKCFTTLICVILLVCQADLSDSARCKPLSTFRVDCNFCKCSQDGFRYTCTQLRCAPLNKNKFTKTVLDDGHILLVPKDNFDTYDDYVLTRKTRQHEVPYINDQIENIDEDNYQQEPQSQDLDSPQIQDIENWDHLIINEK